MPQCPLCGFSSGNLNDITPIGHETDGATRLYFGYLEVWIAQTGSIPGWYDDSPGQHNVIIEIAP